MYENKKMRKLTFYIAFIGLSLPALAELRFPEIPSKNQPFAFKLQTEYFQTHANYEALGQYKNLPDKNYFRYIAFHPSLSYSPFPLYINFEIFANSFYGSSQTQNVRRELLFKPTAAGAGVKIFHKIKTAYIGGEFRGGIPLYSSFQQTPNEIIVGDGAYFVEPGIWLLFQPSEKFYIYLNSAFRYRFFHLSSLLFARLGGVLQFTPHVDAGMAIDSFFSLLADEYSSQPEQRRSLLKKANAGSYKFYSVNPSVFLSWAAWTELKFKPLFTKIYFHLDTLGQNYAKGFSLGLSMKLKWSAKSSIVDRRSGIRFDFNEENSSFDPEEESRSKKSRSYFEEEEDPYGEKNLNEELKQELDSLRY